MSISPRNIQLILFCILFFLLAIDHLTSPTTKNLAAPADGSDACAPCGAPCPQ